MTNEDIADLEDRIEELEEGMLKLEADVQAISSRQTDLIERIDTTYDEDDD